MTQGQKIPDDKPTLEKNLKRLKLVSVCLSAFLVVSLLAVAVLLALFLQLRSDNGAILTECGAAADGVHPQEFILEEAEHPGPFHELTVAEMKRVRQFLVATIGVVDPELVTLRDPHIFTMDLEMPKKVEVLAHLDHGGPAPPRTARVVVFRGDLEPAVVEERLCGPLDQIQACPVHLELPFAHRHIETREYDLYNSFLMPKIQETFGHLLRESYGGSFDYENCNSDCLNYYNFPVGSGRYAPGVKRQTWIVALHHRAYQSLHPLDFGLLCTVDGVNQTDFHFNKVWYSGVLYNDTQDFLYKYNNGHIQKTRVTYPTLEESMFATQKGRGPPKPSRPLRPPELIEPDGKRYTIRHRKVDYLDLWSFHFRMSTVYGPSIFDVRFLGERIAYEISLGEIVVFYSGFNPMQRQAFYVDSMVLTGSQSKSLLAGADCPTTATFLPLTVTAQGQAKPVVFPRAICVFEQNLGTPLRRHHSYSRDAGQNYGGMLDSALVVRSIHAIENYDYIVDFTFHQNGALGVSISQSGFLLTSFYSPGETPYGNRITDRITGAIHTHLANFKVDVDINGTTNRHETLNIQEETVDLRQAEPENSKYSQIKFSHQLKKNERHAAYQHDFTQPAYYIFHNDQVRNKYGERKAYRLVNNGMVKHLLQPDVGNEGTQSWARYQLAVTRHKDQERTTGNPYAQWVHDRKVVDFERFVADNENIVDEDLVAWVTLGLHHIPHSEDLPVTSTSGKQQTFYLYPYNYYPECPSVMSRDAIYVSLKDPEDSTKGLQFDFHGTGDSTSYPNGGTCKYRPHDVSSFWTSNPDELLEITKNKGVI